MTYRPITVFALVALMCTSTATISCRRDLPPSVDTSESSRRPNILLISIDTLRADHLGIYGYEKPTSPGIDAFAQNAIVFERAYGPSYHTADSHMSLFTSVYPSVHRIRNLNDPNLAVRSLSQRIPTFTEVLKREGYVTAGFHGGGNISPQYGFDRGFDQYVHTKTTQQPLQWLQDGPNEPFFLFFHTYHVHDPYTPSPPYDRLHDPDYRGDMISDRAVFDAIVAEQGFVAARKQYWDQIDPHRPDDLRHVIALYDGGINEVDLMVMELVDTALERYPNTIVVILSDHGEEFFEHGRFLHDDLYEECLHVPLIIKMPRVDEGSRVSRPVSLIDVGPTLLTLLGMPVPETFQGTDLFDESTPVVADRMVFSEKVFSNDPAPGDPRNVALITSRWKAIRAQTTQLYDLVNDPGEHDDLSRSLPMAEYDRTIDSFSLHNDGLYSQYHLGVDEKFQNLSEEQLEALRQLGYIE